MKMSPEIQNNTHKTLVIKINKRIVLVATLILVVGASVIITPKVNDYMDVSRAIKSAKKLQEAGEYQKALSLLGDIENRWTTESTKVEISKLIENEKRFVNNQNTLETALTKKESGEFEEARTLLLTIGSDFPEYDRVDTNINEVQSVIETQLKEGSKQKAEAARKAIVAKAEAEKRAYEEATLRASRAAAAQIAAVQAAATQEENLFLLKIERCKAERETKYNRLMGVVKEMLGKKKGDDFIEIVNLLMNDFPPGSINPGTFAAMVKSLVEKRYNENLQIGETTMR